jgi:putative ABC transport system permease protein
MINFLIRNGFRSLAKQMPYSFINILGLTIGLASVIMILIWITAELNFDRFHKDGDRIYRVNMRFTTPNKQGNLAIINAPAGPEFKKAFASVENMVRLEIDDISGIYDEKTIKLKLMYADTTFNDMFPISLKEGNPEECMNDPLGIILTSKTAQRIMGTADPLGKHLLISGNNYTVKGVMADPPANTSFQFDALAPLSVRMKGAYVHWDGGFSCYTFLKLAKGSDLMVLQKQIDKYMEGAINNKYHPLGYSLDPYLQNIGDIHLYSDAEYEPGEKGSIKQILLFSGIGMLILLIACFNFVNISTALSFKRAKEVSVKKIFGSDRIRIVSYFIFESAISIMIAVLFSLLLVKILLPLTSSLLGQALSFSVISTVKWFIILLLVFIFCTVFASFYSAVYLSSTDPLTLLSKVYRGKRKQYSRNILVTAQYTISIALIICCLVIFSQMQYIRKTDKGFNEKNILLINLNPATSAKYEYVLDKFRSVPGVGSVTVSAGGQPGVGFFMNGYFPEGVEKPILARAVYVDENYFSTMGISLIDGRNFRNIRSDSNKVVINKTFARMLGWDLPIGKTISRNGRKYEVIGEVKDFNTSSLYNKTEPIFISTVNEVGSFENLVIRYNPSMLNDVIRNCESVIRDINHDYPFEYTFLEDSMAESYGKDKKMNLLFLILSFIAIFISSLGLFGLATFSTQSRMKEISIRKINGAAVSEVYIRFNLELLQWILLSFIIAAPVGYYAMTKWLNNFAYRISISAGLIFLSCFIALCIGIVTVSRAANKAARKNPTETLRLE